MTEIPLYQVKDGLVATLGDSVTSQYDVNNILNLHADADARRIEGLIKNVKDLRTHIGCDEGTIEKLEKQVHAFRLDIDRSNDSLEAVRLDLDRSTDTLKAYRWSNETLRDTVKDNKMDIKSLKDHLTQTLAEIWELGLNAKEKARLADIDEEVKEMLAAALKKDLTELRYITTFGESVSGPMVCAASKIPLLPDQKILVVEGWCCCGKEVTGVRSGAFYKHVYAFELAMGTYERHIQNQGSSMCSVCKGKGLKAKVDSVEVTTPRNYETQALWRHLRACTGCVSAKGLGEKRRLVLDEFQENKAARK